MDDPNEDTLLALTADIVVAHVGNNMVSVGEVGTFIEQVHAALAGLGAPEPEPAPAAQQPAVPIRSSVKPDHIVCLEDGRKLKTLRRYLRTRYGMTPEEYRAKWKLPPTYPMVASDYAEQRRSLAHAIGLGRKQPPPPPPVKRGRKPAATRTEKPATPKADRTEAS